MPDRFSSAIKAFDFWRESSSLSIVRMRFQRAYIVLPIIGLGNVGLDRLRASNPRLLPFNWVGPLDIKL